MRVLICQISETCELMKMKMAAAMETPVQNQISESLSSWKRSSCPLLDLREFKDWNLVGKVANIHWKKLGTEGFLLPPRETKFAGVLPMSRMCIKC